VSEIRFFESEVKLAHGSDVAYISLPQVRAVGICLAIYAPSGVPTRLFFKLVIDCSLPKT